MCRLVTFPVPLIAALNGKYRSFLYTTPGALFRKSMLLDRDFLNSAPGLYKENSFIDSGAAYRRKNNILYDGL